MYRHVPAALILRARRALSFALVASLALAVPDSLRAAEVPAGFTDSIVAGGLDSPTAMEIAPDGRIFVSEQTGALRVIKNGALLATPFVTLSVNSSGERGLLGVAFDPDFASNRFVYVYYTTASAPIHNRVSRFTASAGNPDVAAPGRDGAARSRQPECATNHNGGALHFGADGKLYVAAGENAVGSNSQSLANLLGKILPHQLQRQHSGRQSVLRRDPRQQSRDLGVRACAIPSRSRSSLAPDEC